MKNWLTLAITALLPINAFAQDIEMFGMEDAWWAGFLDNSWPVLSAILGLVDGFNPCAMWTLFILIGFLLSIDNKRHRWIIGSVFVASSGIIYLAALLTYLFGFSAVTQMVATSAMSWVFVVIGIMAIGAGINGFLTLKKKGIECEVQDAESRKNFTDRIQAILAREQLWLILGGVTVLAFSVNAFELLCSFAIPTIFTATIISLDLSIWEQLSAILIYDIMYVLDDIVVLVIALKTLSLKVFDQKLVKATHLIGSILLIVIGLFLLLDSEGFTSLFI